MFAFSRLGICNIYVNLWMKGSYMLSFEVNLDIFSKSRLFDCFDCIIGSYNILMIYLYFMGDI